MTKNALTTKQEKRTEVAAPERTYGVMTFAPRCDIFETGDEIILYADVPGVQAGDVDVRFENRELTLHGKCAPRQYGVDYLTCEYGIGDYYRSFTIGEEIDTDKIAAEVKHGVLTIHLPKSESVKPKRIAVKAA